MAAIFNGFKYSDHLLKTEEVSLEEIAEKVGTPCFVYVSSLITAAYEELQKALAPVPHLICYAVKANPNIAILKTFTQLSAGADVVSAGELYRALEAEIPSEKIVFSGVGKTKEEIDFALRKEFSFNVESEQELLAIDLAAKELKRVADICLRINPDVDPKTHPYIATGLRKSKFGIPYRKALDLIRGALRLKNVNLVGLGCHIGSQITEIKPFLDSMQRILRLMEQAKEKFDCDFDYIDMGGGLGVTYHHESPPSVASWAEALVKELEGRKLTLVVEPGRSLVANAGILLTKVLYGKRGDSRNFIIVDAGMNDLIRPALYEAYHAILPARYKRYRKIKASIVGPCCESGDIITNDRRVQNFQPGDLLAVMSCGAYASSMSSTYNSRPRIAEVLVHNSRFHVIRERESYEDLLAREKLPPHLRRTVAITA